MTMDIRYSISILIDRQTRVMHIVDMSYVLGIL